MILVLPFFPAACSNHTSLQALVKAESWGIEGAPEPGKIQRVTPLLSHLVLQEWGLDEINAQ